MGKIKGWTKSNKVNKSMKEERWDNDNSAVSISIVYDGELWRLWLYDVFDDQGNELGSSKNKEVIRKLAINYMRTNPNG
jgi:hypothetical protein